MSRRSIFLALSLLLACSDDSSPALAPAACALAVDGTCTGGGAAGCFLFQGRAHDAAGKCLGPQVALGCFQQPVSGDSVVSCYTKTGTGVDYQTDSALVVSAEDLGAAGLSKCGSSGVTASLPACP